MFVRCHRIIIQWQRMIVRQRRTKKHTVCDKEFIIEETLTNEVAPYKISDGYVKEEEIYKKV